jgi:hypothetical protein
MDKLVWLAVAMGVMLTGCGVVPNPPEPGEVVLVIDVEGQGDVLVSPDGSTFIAGDRIDLSAVPDAGWVFDRWEGDVSSTDSKITILMDSDTSVTAVFVRIESDDALLAVVPTGGGVVTLSPPGEDRGTGFLFDRGEIVTLEAFPDDGFVFDGWYLDDGTFLDDDFVVEVELLAEETYIVARFVEEEPLPPIDLTGAEVFAADDEFLGVISADPFDPESLANPFGPYGDEFSSLSIWNPFSIYGSGFNDLSAYDPFAENPPEIFLDGEFAGYLTKNTDFSSQIDPDDVAEAIGRFDVIRE